MSLFIRIIPGYITELFCTSTFKYCCSTRSQKYEKKNLTYACLSRVVRSGGFKIALAARFSIIPPHCQSNFLILRFPDTHSSSLVTTTVFASSGMGFYTFIAAAVCSLPKQLVTVYIGVLLEDSINGTSSRDKIASIAVAIIFAGVTSFAFRYVNRKMDEIKPAVIYERRKHRCVFLRPFCVDFHISSSLDKRQT